MLGELGILTSTNPAEPSLGPCPADEVAYTATLVAGAQVEGTLNEPEVAGAGTVDEAATVPPCSACIVYDVIVLLPLNAGAFHETDTVVLPCGVVVTAPAETD